MGNVNIVQASPEAREALVNGAKAAKDVAAKHLKNIKEAAKSDTVKDVAVGAAVGAAAGALSPIPGGFIVGGAVGAGAAAVVEGVKALEKASTKEKDALKAAGIALFVGGPVIGTGTYMLCSGKAKAALEKMWNFIKEHPEALAAQAK